MSKKNKSKKKKKNKKNHLHKQYGINTLVYQTIIYIKYFIANYTLQGQAKTKTI
jgi:glucose uptake protein GlcU